MKEDSNILEKANEIMDQAIDKAGELLCAKPLVAELILRQVLKCDPEHLSALQLLGLCKHRMGDNAEAIEIIQTALDLDPTCADNYNNLGLAYAGVGQHERAIEAIMKAIEHKPEQFLFKNNLAIEYRAIGDYQNAIRQLREAIEVQPQAQLWLNLGGIYGEMKNYQDAKECFTSALAIDPEYPAAHIDTAFMHFLQGNWAKGFEEYEWRFWYYPQMKFYMSNYDWDKKWDGKADVNGKKILIYGEQGMGDIIMFSRYAKYLKEKGAHVTIHVSNELAGLIKGIEGVDEVNTRDIFNNSGPPFPEYDYQFSIMSFPHLLDNPKVDGSPYITPVSYEFREIIKKNHSDTLNIGIVWAGNPSHPHDQRRSIPLKYFKSLQELPFVKLFSLQMDLRRRQYGATYRTGDNEQYQGKFQSTNTIVDYCEGCDGMNIIDLTAMIQNFQDTAVILAGLDLVVCCDTAIGHLAGAMGIPVFMLIPYNPDWRWGLDGNKTCWYQSMTLFRQEERNNWDEPLKKLTEAVGKIK